MPIESNRRGDAAPDIYYREKESAIYDLEYAWKTDDVEFWQTMAREYATDGRALELACGTLRIALPLAESGMRVTGVDISPFMLEHARKKLGRFAPDIQTRITLHEGDMRAVRLGERFNFVYLPFNTFLVLLTTQDQLALFETVRAHLAPGGVFVFDIFMPDINRLKVEHNPAWSLEVDQTIKDIGFRFQRDHARELDPLRQTMVIHFRMREFKDNVLLREWLSDLHIAYIFPRELEHLIARAGFEIVHFWGDYARHDFYSLTDPQKQIVVARAMR
ncbi:MAG: class I SAM-dependent methyltransferase [Chloroflexi bacterium]|nr:class I SAM-dependent methyltransferase [Chloroflexota bacterium]